MGDDSPYDVEITLFGQELAFNGRSGESVKVERGQFSKRYLVTVEEVEAGRYWVDTDQQPNEFLDDELRSAIISTLNLNTQPVIEWVDNFPDEYDGGLENLFVEE